MSSIHSWKKCILILGMVSMLFALSGCGVAKMVDRIESSVDSATDRGLARIDEAIVELANANADWQRILNDLASDLPAELQSTIGLEVSRTLERAISASGSEVKCIVDFLHERVREDLIRIRAILLKQPLPPLRPVFCDVESVDMAMVNDGRQNNLLIYGYNFDVQNPVQVFLNENNQEVDVNAEQKNLFVLTHYKMELNLGRNGVVLSPDSQYFVIRWGADVMSEIPIKQPVLPVCKIEPYSYKPSPIHFTPREHLHGDGDFDGHGPKISVRVQLWPHFGGSLDVFGLDLHIEMSANELESSSIWDLSDGTSVVGYNSIEYFVPVPPGYLVDTLITQPISEVIYTDENQEVDTRYPANGGPVEYFEIVGDTEGSEVGTKTGVTIHFKTIELQIRQFGNCR